MNCNDDTPCEYECGRWGSHTRPKLGYVCSDERKPACMWGGYCYDVFKSPATRPLYYAWAAAFWVAVGILGWAALILLCGVVLNKSPDADATTNAKGVTYAVLWLLLVVGGPLQTRVVRGVWLAALPICVSVACFVAWASLMGSFSPSQPATPAEYRFESMLEPAYWFGRISLQVTGPATCLRLLFMAMAHCQASVARTQPSSVEPFTSAISSRDAEAATSLPLYTLVSSCFVMGVLYLVGSAAPSSIANAVDRTAASSPTLGSATLNSGLLGGGYLCAAIHIQMSRSRNKLWIGVNLSSSRAKLTIALLVLFCWLSAAAGFTLASGVLVLEGPSNLTSLGTEGRAGDHVALFQCALSLVPCIACLGLAGAAATSRAAARVGAIQQVATLHGMAGARSDEADGWDGGGSTAVALGALVGCLTGSARILGLDGSILFGAMSSQKCLNPLCERDPISVTLLVLVAASVDVLMLPPRLMMAIPVTVVTAVAAPLLLMCARGERSDGQPGEHLLPAGGPSQDACEPSSSTSRVEVVNGSRDPKVPTVLGEPLLDVVGARVDLATDRYCG